MLRAVARLYSQSSAPKQIRSCEVDDFVTTSVEDRLGHVETEPDHLVQLSGWRHSELLSIHRYFQQSRAVMIEGLYQQRTTPRGLLRRQASSPRASAIVAQSGLRKSMAHSRNPATFISSFTKPSESFLKTTNLTGNCRYRNNRNPPSASPALRPQTT